MSNPYRKPDRFTRKARDEGYAARSVYKLEEVQRRFRVLKQGQRVVDLGCFPGSWSKYVLQKIGKRGTLVGVDLETPALAGGVWITRSVHDVTIDEMREALGGTAHVVLSDMAPRTTGQRLFDHVEQIALARRALEVAVALLAPGGSFVVKVFDGEDANAYCDDVRAHFGKLKRVRPEAVRKNSREFFAVATGLKG